MALPPYTPEKLNEGCSLVYLIDENLCLSKSLDVINYNVASLSSSLVSIENQSQFWNNIYTNFSANSAAWLIIASNLSAYSNMWTDAYSTVKNLSADWNREYTLYYPSMVLLSEWYASESVYKSQVKEWLDINFPSKTEDPQQFINVQVNLYHSQPFSFTFSESLMENCAPSGGISLKCEECARPYRGCNHHGVLGDGSRGHGPCDNAYKWCKASVKSLETEFKCEGTGGKMLRVSYELSSYDTSIARIITLKFLRKNGTWRLA